MRIEELAILKDNLPIFPGVHRKEEYLNSAILMPLVRRAGEYHFLFEQRSAYIRQPGEICFPGGRHDEAQDASYLDTAVRETMEELGLGRERIRIQGRMNTLVTPMGTVVEPFIGILDIPDLSELKLDRCEVERVFTLPVAFFEATPPEKYKVRLLVEPSYVDEDGNRIDLLPVEQLKLPEKYSRPWGGRTYSVLLYGTPEGFIWGITAEFVDGFVNKLKA